MLNVGGSTAPANSTFTVAASGITVALGSSGVSTVTVTPSNGYTGTIGWTVTSSPALTAGCYSIANTTVNGTTPVTTPLTIYTSAAACSSSNLSNGGVGAKRRFAAVTQANRGKTPAMPGSGTGIAMAGLLLAGLCGSRSRKLRIYLALAVVSVATLSTFGCGSGSSSTNPTPTSGSYTITITGTDTLSGKTASTTMMLTVQ